MKEIAKKVLIINLICICIFFTTGINCVHAETGKQMVANCGGTKSDGFWGGESGDQDGNEYKVKPWYVYGNGGWDCVLRYPDSQVAELIANMAVAAANNDSIGYDQNHPDRYTFWNQLQANNYNPSSISTLCEADCSSSTAAIVKSVGYLRDIPKLQQLSEENTTFVMIENYSAAGFEVLYGSEYTDTADNLLPGDIMLSTQYHTNIYVGDAEGGNGEGGSSGGIGKFPIDDVTINLDEQEFEFAGTPQTVTYAGHITPGRWIFTKVSQFVDFIVAIITNGIKMSVLGWAMSIEGAFDSSIKLVEGN